MAISLPKGLPGREPSLHGPSILISEALLCSLDDKGTRRGGLIKWADLVGADYVCKRLSQWAEHFRADELSGIFEPCEYLKAAASSKRLLGAGVSSSSKL